MNNVRFVCSRGATIMAEKLTKRTIDAATVGSGQRALLWDRNVVGFGCRITRNSKTYFVRYRVGAGGRTARQVDYTIGRHGAPWTVEEARKEAKRVLGEVAGGQDPQAEKTGKRRGRSETTFGAVAQVFLSRHLPSLRPSTALEYRRIVESTLIPAWHDMGAREIERAAILRILDEKQDTAPGAARFTFSVTRKLFGFAVERGLIERNPCEGMRGPPLLKARDRYLADAELINFWRATEELGAPFGPPLRVLLLTGQRRDEVAQMRWSDVDFDRAVWIIPAERAKNGKAHEVDLAPLALKIIQEQPHFGEFVFTTRGDRPLSGWSKAKVHLAQLIGPIDPWRIHDLRRTCATGMAALGVAPHVVERVLNHMSGVNGGLVAVYQHHQHRNERRGALAAWDAHVTNLIENKPLSVAGGAASDVI